MCYRLYRDKNYKSDKILCLRYTVHMAFAKIPLKSLHKLCGLNQFIVIVIWLRHCRMVVGPFSTFLSVELFDEDLSSDP